VEALVCDAVWVLLVLPDGSGWTYDSFGIQTGAAIVGRHAGGSVEEGAVGTFAAVVGLDAGLLVSDGMADLGTAEGGWLAGWCWMFEQFVATLGQSGLLDWTVFADFWILINSVWTVLYAVTVDLLVQRAECYAR
jgi:hypothetical protein